MKWERPHVSEKRLAYQQNGAPLEPPLLPELMRMTKGMDPGPDDPGPLRECQTETLGLERKGLEPSAQMEPEPNGKFQQEAATKSWKWGLHPSGGQHRLWNKTLLSSS